MITIKALKSEIIDEIILNIEDELKVTGRHLIRTSTILERCHSYIDLHDDIPAREEILEIGAKQIIQSRLYAHGYYSIASRNQQTGKIEGTGYFVNLDECENGEYLDAIIRQKDGVIKNKILARNVIKNKKGIEGQMVFVPDENGYLSCEIAKTTDEIIADLEADAI